MIAIQTKLTDMNKYMKWLVWPIAFLPLVYLGITWSSLPDTIALHFDFSGKPDRFGDRNELFRMTALLSGLSIAMFYILSNIYRIDPKKYAAENKDRLIRMAFIIAIFMSAVSMFVIYSASKGSLDPGAKYIFAGVGLLFCFLGNYMHTIKPNYFAGIRLPWTLNNEQNWRKTHLLAGKMWFGGGILLAVLSLALPEQVTRIAFFIILAVLVIVPGVYSYRMYRAGNPS
jgi:uncharacterized membrane protein